MSILVDELSVIIRDSIVNADATREDWNRAISLVFPESNAPDGYLDVWLRFDSDDDELADYEANTRKTDTGYAIDWYHNDVGQVVTETFDTLADAYDWYEAHGYEDYTV